MMGFYYNDESDIRVFNTENWYCWVRVGWAKWVIFRHVKQLIIYWIANEVIFESKDIGLYEINFIAENLKYIQLSLSISSNRITEKKDIVELNKY